MRLGGQAVELGRYRLSRRVQDRQPADVAHPEVVREWLRRTQHVKPGSQMPEVDLSAAQVNRLVTYLESLK